MEYRISPVMSPNTDSAPTTSYPDEKKSMRSMAFGRLPDEIIELILQLTDPNVFASLIVLNRKWRTVSQQSHLYAHHLSRCPSYSAAHPSISIPKDEESLPSLRRLFAREIKRNLFEAYLRPEETVINLVSTSISSSSAPGGEAFHFGISPRGHYVLAYSSSRIHVLDVISTKITVKRELKILRRPASITITDDGSVLAVLSTDMQIDLYDLRGEHPKRTRSIELDHTPRTIALSPTGSVLAAAYDAGVEVSSLDPGSLSTERRAVKCYAVDSLAFSRDGTQLLGTTAQSGNPSTVILTAPYYEPGGNLPGESTSTLWTTSILFPNGSRDCSHAVLLPSDSDDEASWTFTYDRVFETFRAVRIDDLRNGTTYFTGPTPNSNSNLLPSTLPAASETGELVVSGFKGNIWVYGVPEHLEALPKSVVNHLENALASPTSPISRRNSDPSLRSITRPCEGSPRTPQWQLLCDRNRNTFVEGRNIATLDRVSAMTWVTSFSNSSHAERLIAVAPGVSVHQPESEDDSMHPTDGGRITMLDFDYGIQNGHKRTVTIEVGNRDPEVLEEEHRDLDTEVAIVRRRTIAQRRGNRSRVSRSSTTISREIRSPVPPMPPMPNLRDMGDPFSQSAATAPRKNPSIPASEVTETSSIDDDDDGFDDPYSQTNPRSHTTLRRAATAAAVNRRLNPRSVAQEHVEYRRADGREEHPHESDADNWVPPPPPYTKELIPPLPEHIRRSILAETAAANLQRANTQRTPSIDLPGLEGNALHRSRTFSSVSSASSVSRRDRFPFPRTRSESATMTLGSLSPNDGVAPVPRIPSPVSPNFDDLYDVSPPASSQPSPRWYSEPALTQQYEDSSPELTPDVMPEPRAALPASTPATNRQLTRKPVGTANHPPANIPPSPSPPTPAPAMLAILKRPVSPVPQPQTTPDINERLTDWEEPRNSAQCLNLHRELAPSPALLTRDQEVTSRPKSDHRLNGRPPLAPQRQRDVIESQAVSNRQNVELPVRQVQQEVQHSEPYRRSETLPSNTSRRLEDDEAVRRLGRRAETTPMSAQASFTAVQVYVPQSLVGPSAEQMARLNSRRERLPSQVLTDSHHTSVNYAPQGSYQQSGNYSQPSNYAKARPMSTTGQRSVSEPLRRFSSGNRSYWECSQQRPPRELQHPSNSSTAPQNAVGAYRSSPSRSNITYTPSAYQQQTASRIPPHRPVSLNAPRNRHAPMPSPNSLGPTVNRLDTIYSATSVEPPNTNWQQLTKLVPISLARNPSRAKRSAAKHIKDAKKRGWRASMRPDKKKDQWGDASSAGWTNVSEMRGEMGEQGEKKEKSGKCAVM
ncbi:hypothetical protein BJ878DRAFT_265593 [Calycina marina]|uniref:F-box domain-containing protein n=1 Tax=Calycina marina TaxID=1763456 RepID=A0A9P8CJC3_9HELO|nr:hypothetical protein BJ878DRAFT_265593 [Calycina marina]